MPNLDKTGPTGDGPTGLGRGGCVQPRGRRNRGQAEGLGLGRRAVNLYEEEKILEQRLSEIKKRKKED